MHNKDAETPCHGLFLIYRFRMAKKGKKRGIFFFTYVCMYIYLAYCIYESPRAKTRHLGPENFFDLDAPLKCGESPLSIPLCGEIR